MNNKTLAIFGIITYILSVISTATDLEGNYTMPIWLNVISVILWTIFVIMAVIRLWKKAKVVSTMLVLTAIILNTLPLTVLWFNITKTISFITYIWAVVLLWKMAKREGLAKNNIKDFGSKYGYTSEEVSSIQKDLQKGNREAASQRAFSIQEQKQKKFREITGVDIKDIIAEIGQEVSWADIINHVFRVLEFDRSGTSIEKNNKVKAKNFFKPYGYLIAESPIITAKVRIPIIHRDDFLLAANVFDSPKWQDLVTDVELLVTYSPKILLPKGLSGSPHHVLHYVITPRGTLDSYYSINNDIHMAKPDPKKLFGSFVYQGYLKVQVNLEPE